MNIAELKLELIRKINECNDINLLMQIADLLEIENFNDADENFSEVNESVIKYEKIRVFTADEQRKIDLALEQYNNGECISDEEAQKEIQAWLED